MSKIQWIYRDDPGFWDSYEGRFSVSPIYTGRTTPQGYELRDELQVHLRKTVVGAQETYESHIYPGMSTVAEAKAQAETILNKERNR